MICSTQIVRLDGSLPLCASVDDTETDTVLAQVKRKTTLLIRQLSQQSEPRASVESGPLTLHYLIEQHIIYLTITDKSYPRKLAFTYLNDIATEFSSTHPSSEVMSPSLRPYAYMAFDTFIQRTKKTYQDTRATSNLDKLNDELKDVTKVMTKNIEDLLYRGDSLERMGDMSSRLRDESKKYRQAAVRINWEYMWKQYGPLCLVGLVIILFIWWRFF